MCQSVCTFWVKACKNGMLFGGVFVCRAPPVVIHPLSRACPAHCPAPVPRCPAARFFHIHPLSRACPLPRACLAHYPAPVPRCPAVCFFHTSVVPRCPALVQGLARAVPRMAFSTHPLFRVLSRAAPCLSRAVPQFVFYYTSAVPRLSRTLSRACAALSRGLFLPYIRCPARCPAPALSRAQLLWTWRIERPMRKIYIYSFICFFLVLVWQLCQKNIRGAKLVN